MEFSNEHLTAAERTAMYVLDRYPDSLEAMGILALAMWGIANAHTMAPREAIEAVLEMAYLAPLKRNS